MAPVDDLAAEEADPEPDGVPARLDNCRAAFNPGQSDIDGDGAGDACDLDIDADRVTNDVDDCIDVTDPFQVDSDHDGLGDVCDPDRDGDGVDDVKDSCLDVPNADQLDSDDDGEGDACEAFLKASQDIAGVATVPLAARSDQGAGLPPTQAATSGVSPWLAVAGIAVVLGMAFAVLALRRRPDA